MNRKLITALAACGLALASQAAEPDAEIAAAKPASTAEAKDAAMAKPREALADAKPGPTSTVPAKPPPATADIQDVVFRSSQGWKRLRLHVQVDGKPGSRAWTAFIDRVFAFYDRNDDKFLSPQEMARVPNPMVFNQGFNLLFNGLRGGQNRMNFADLDTNKDGKVSLEEFRAYVAKSGFSPITVSILPPQPTAQQLTDAFYKHVNTKGDGKLTKADLAVAWQRLGKLDMDEDEIISMQELLSQASNPFGAQQVSVAYGMSGQPQPQTSPFISLPRDWTIETATNQLLATLDREKTTILPYTGSRFDTGLPPFMRDQLRETERDFLKTWLAKPADLELTVQLGNLAQGVGRLMSLGAEPAGVKPLRPNGKITPLEKSTKLGGDGILRLTMNDALVEFGRTQGYNNRFDGNSIYYTRIFKEAAGEKKYLTKQELMENPQIQFFTNVFDDLDRNADGKLTVQELQNGFELLSAGSTCQVYVNVVDQGRGLFDLIDTNHDGRLTRRELLNVLKNFSTLDKNGDGAIERTELPSQYRVTASQGPSNGSFAVPAGFGMVNNRPMSTSGKGPMWFRKMDRNGDGEVSEREFLGTPEEFKAIDLDGDGLISPDEAEKFDAAKKKQVAARR